MYLLIVESPNKAKTISSYLKEQKDKWIVLATGGHILNLPENELGLTYTDSGVQAKWVYEKNKKAIVDKIAQFAKNAKMVFIATDDDREGEKIAYDAVTKAKIKNFKRVVFKEITKEAVTKKLYENIRDIDSHIVEAAKIRRFIDREVGYPISQIIKKDFQRRKEKALPRGVGRVLSPSLHILVEREKQIEQFVPEDYKKIVIEYIKNGIYFRCTNSLQFKKKDEKELQDMLALLNNSPHYVYDYKRKTADVPPKKPLITSTLQYGAWYLYGLKPSYTMKLAQELFEWGYITYHRTDSYRISDEAYEKIVSLLLDIYPEEYVLKTKRVYKNKKSSRDAHEAIRPTIFTPDRFPKHVKKLEHITPDHAKVYELIWYRTLATQMRDAIYDNSELTVDIGGNYFYARANDVIFDGWEKLMGHLLIMSDRGEDMDSWKEKRVVLPEFSIGEELYFLDITTTDHKTVRPQRYGIGRFITTLDNKGIARPSTLDTIIDSLEKKNYVNIIKGMLYPTELGIKVDEWTCQNAPWLCSIEHAKEFEEKLDAIEKGEIDNAEDILLEYRALVAELESKFGIQTHSNTPSKEQIELVKKIAEEKGIEVGEELLKNKKLAAAFIKQHIQKRELGICPACRKGKVYYSSKGLYCSKYKNGCKFYITKKTIENFFSRIKIPLQSSEAESILKGCFRPTKKTIEYEAKNGKKYNVKVVVEYDEKYGWRFGFEFK